MAAAAEKVGAVLKMVAVSELLPVPLSVSVAVTSHSMLSFVAAPIVDKSNVASTIPTVVAVYEAPEFWLEKAKVRVGLPPSTSLAVAVHVIVAVLAGSVGLIVTESTIGLVFSMVTVVLSFAERP